MDRDPKGPNDIRWDNAGISRLLTDKRLCKHLPELTMYDTTVKNGANRSNACRDSAAGYWDDGVGHDNGEQGIRCI